MITFLCIDHATELRNAAARIRELEAAASSQRAEVAISACTISVLMAIF